MRIVDDRAADGVRHRGFVLERGRRRVPGALWTPLVEPDRPGCGLPLVLIGHGASGSKYQDYVRSLGRGLAADHGLAAAAIDGPVHGSRRQDGGRKPAHTFLDFAAAWSSDPTLTDEMVADWQATLDELLRLDGISGPVGYWGLSMGTILGLPFVAADDRVSVAVLGLMGLTGPTAERIGTDAPAVSCPVLFLVQWDDEIFPRERAFELFEALGTPDKRLHANPGPHGAVPHQEFSASARFLVGHLDGAPSALDAPAGAAPA